MTDYPEPWWSELNKSVRIFTKIATKTGVLRLL
jgi:hypothetical protein